MSSDCPCRATILPSSPWTLISDRPITFMFPAWFSQCSPRRWEGRKRAIRALTFHLPPAGSWGRSCLSAKDRSFHHSLPGTPPAQVPSGFMVGQLPACECCSIRHHFSCSPSTLSVKFLTLFVDHLGKHAIFVLLGRCLINKPCLQGPI